MRTARQPGSRHVFVDRSGRRRRWAVAAGAGFAAVLLLSLVLLVAGLSGASPVHLPGFPEAGGQAKSPTPTPTAKSTAAPAPSTSVPGQPTASATSTVPTPGSVSTSAPGRRPSSAPSHPPHPSKSR
jgi:hypothetical protein